ncbi:MAG: DUF711 family protein [Bryobacteraceae bacterium]
MTHRQLILLFLVAFPLHGQDRPRIRAVTAFIEVDKDNYTVKIQEAQAFLAAAKTALNQAGFAGGGGRITTQPFTSYTKGMDHGAALALLRSMKEVAVKGHSAFNIGPAMVNDDDDPAAVSLLDDALSQIGVTASIIIADEKGIHWKAVHQAAHLVKDVSERSPHGDGNFNFAAVAMMKPYGPYYPASFHLGPGRAFAIAMEGANVVGRVFAQYQDPQQAELHLSQAFSTYTKEAEAVASKIASQTGWTYEGIDATPAPSNDNSIASAIESFLGAPFGSPGTMTASGIITRAVQSTPVKRIGYSGLMIPVMEDKVLARRWAEGTFNIDSILAYSAVCAAGVDTVPLPGNVSEEQIARILGDVAWLARKWNKPLGARLLPAPGKQPGEQTQFTGAMLTNTAVQPLPGTRH